jgi:hypothetical protein
MRKALLPEGSGGDYPALRIAYCFFVESLDEPALDGDWSLDELEPADGVDAEDEGDEDEGEDGEAVLPLPADDEDDGEDGVAEGLLLLELEDDGEDGEVMPLLDPEVEPAPLRSAPRSHAAIRLAPSATETATARVENFMLPP